MTVALTHPGLISVWAIIHSSEDLDKFSELSELCRSRCPKQPGCTQSSLPLCSFWGRGFSGSDVQGWPRYSEAINSFQVLTNSQFPSVWGSSQTFTHENLQPFLHSLAPQNYNI